MLLFIFMYIYIIFLEIELLSTSGGVYDVGERCKYSVRGACSREWGRLRCTLFGSAAIPRHTIYSV